MVISFVEWWLSLFGLTDPESIRLATCIIASGIGLAALYTTVILTFALIGGIFTLLGKS